MESPLVFHGRPVPMQKPQPKLEALPVDPNWQCCRSGDCCTQPAEVVMTKEEASIMVLHAPPSITLQFRPTDDKRFVALKAQPCPLYVFKSCLVYEHRPYNCRRMACLRPDVKTEKFSESSIRQRFMTSRVARRMLIKIQAKAQRWGNKHGWKPDTETV